MQKVLDNLKELPPSTGAKDIDLIFLRGIMESPIVRSLAKVPKTLSVYFLYWSAIHSCASVFKIIYEYEVIIILANIGVLLHVSVCVFVYVCVYPISWYGMCFCLHPTQSLEEA